MDEGKEPSFGSGFERVFVGLTAMHERDYLRNLQLTKFLFLKDKFGQIKHPHAILSGEKSRPYGMPTPRDLKKM